MLFTGSVPELLAKTATQNVSDAFRKMTGTDADGARRMTALPPPRARPTRRATSISDRAWGSEPPRLGPARATSTCLKGIVWREVLRYLHQRERFMSALVRPLIWLFIFAAGFRQTLGVSIIPPYETYVLYEVYVVPGLLGMILLFNAMQSSLSMVYDRETGAMRTLLVSPFPRSFLLRLQAHRRRRGGGHPGLRLPRHLLFLGGGALRLGLPAAAGDAGAARRAHHVQLGDREAVGALHAERADRRRGGRDRRHRLRHLCVAAFAAVDELHRGGAGAASSPA